MDDHHRLLRGAEVVLNGTSTTTPADQTPETKGGDAFLSITLCILVLAPCVLACIFQIAYKIKKRRQDRVEREILEVTTNPTSRRMVLDEIFKGSSKLVEFPSNKRRVQVKKYRKKTPEEHRLGCRSMEDEHDASSDNEVQTDDDDANELDEEMGSSVQGRMIICISDKNSEEKDTADDASASTIDSCESTNYCDNGKGPNLVEEDLIEDEEPSATVSATVTLTEQVDEQRSVKRNSPNCLRDSIDAEETPSLSLTKLSIPDVDESAWNALALCPKLSPNPHDYDESKSEDEKKGEILRTSSNDLARDSSCNIAAALSLWQESETNRTSFGLVIPIVSDDDDNDDDDDDDDDDASIEDEEKPIRQSSIFRSEIQGGAKIEPTSSTLTEVTSNVVDTGVKADVLLSSLKRPQKASSDLSIGSDSDTRLKNTFPLKHIASNKTDTSSKADSSSHISYFSFEDETIASDQADMCAICICPYDEGDVRIFSKRCPHSFHKDCLFEWLVKGHDECPCCRSEMVSKSEVKETSASLIGTERLAQALASTMVEAPPLRFPQARIARQMFARARQNRRRSGQDENNTESSARQNTVNSHWLWNARFEIMPNSASVEQRASLPSVNEAFPQSPGLDQSATTNQVTPPTPLQTRSYDAITDSQPAEDLSSRSFDAITDSQQTSQGRGSSRNAASNPRNFHNHWANWNNAQLMRTPRRSNSTQTSSPATSPLSRLRQSGSGASPHETLAVTVLPTI
eukprot:scaffold12800_cov202-Skeletonema_marinoi.AAC.3